MKTCRVRWEIDVDAETPREAAEKARSMMPFAGSGSVATVFDVFAGTSDADRRTTVDLAVPVDEQRVPCSQEHEPEDGEDTEDAT